MQTTKAQIAMPNMTKKTKDTTKKTEVKSTDPEGIIIYVGRH